MTVASPSVTKALVNEIGLDKVLCVFRYKNMEGIKGHYAVFLLGDKVDVFNNPYVIDPKLVYTMAQGWLYDG